MRRRDRRPASRTVADSQRDRVPISPATPPPSLSIRRPPISLHLFGRAWYRRASSSPTQSLRELVNRRFHPFADRLAHAGNGQQIKRFLYCIPIFFGNEHGVVALAGNTNRRVRFRRLINQAIKVGACFAGAELGHTDILE